MVTVESRNLVSRYHGAVTSDFWFPPNAKPWLKWAAIKIQSGLKPFKMIMPHSRTSNHISLGIFRVFFSALTARLSFVSGGAVIIHHLCFPLAGEARRPWIAWVSRQTRTQGVWWIPLCSSTLGKPSLIATRINHHEPWIWRTDRMAVTWGNFRIFAHWSKNSLWEPACRNLWRTQLIRPCPVLNETSRAKVSLCIHNE